MTKASIANQNVSRETYEALLTFSAMTKKWTKKINLIAPSTVDDIWNRHFVDSAQLMTYAPKAIQSWADLGSGGGFPGIIIAILAKEHSPTTHISLIESDQRKATFLRVAARELDLNISIYPQRIDAVTPQGADVVSARALMSLCNLLPHLHNHLKPDGIAILHKGRRFADELKEAKSDWDFELAQYPSITDPEARILILKGITRA